MSTVYETEAEIGLLERTQVFWRRQLSAPLPSGLLPEIGGDSPRIEAAVRVEFPVPLGQALLQLACGDDASLHVLMLAVCHVILDGLSIEDGSQAIVCPMAHVANSAPVMAPIRARLRPTQTFRELVFELRETVLEAQGLIPLGLHELAALVPGTDPARLGRYVLASRQLHRSVSVENSELAFEIDRIEQCVGLALHFDASRWQEGTARRLLEIVIDLGNLVVTNSRRTIADLGRALARPDESGCPSALRADTFVEMFEAAARAGPLRPALVALVEMPNLYDPGERKWLPASMGYGALNGRANQLARALVERGVGTGSVIAIAVDDPFKQVEAMLAVAKTGAAYLTLDERRPPTVLEHLTAAGVAVVIAEGRFLPEGVLNPQLTVLDTDAGVTAGHSLSNLGVRPDPAAACYVCFTSGTTGAAMKGVVVEHAALANYAAWRMREFMSSEADVTLQLVPWTADGCGANLFPTLCAGGTLVLASRGIRTDSTRIAAVMAQFGVTQMSLVPSVFSDLLDSLDARALRSLRTLVLAGEPATPELLARLLEIAPQLTVYNEYGPTEATIASSAHRGMRPESVRTIGHPIDNVKLRVANHRGESMPAGMPGEIWIAGAGLARGYLNDPVLTSERFAHDDQGCRWYRTRDSGAWDANGRLCYIGRLDRELKRRGRRVDLAWLEERLRCLADSAYARAELSATDHVLRAWVVGAPGSDGHALRDALARELPPELVPDSLSIVAKLPLDGSHAGDAEVSTRNGRQAPTRAMDELATQIAQVFEELLGLSAGSVTSASSFFELGGHSLKVTQLAGRLLKALRVNLRISEIYDAPSVEGLCRLVRKRREQAGLAIPQAPDRDAHPTSREQVRIYWSRCGSATNRTLVMLWQQPIEMQRFDRALAALVERHEALRTSFDIAGTELRQRIHATAGTFDYTARLGTHFAFDTAPLLRVAVSADRVTLETHALVADDESLSLLEADLRALYDSLPLPALPLRHRDWTEWTIARRRTSAFEASARYWRDRLSGGAPGLGLAREALAGRERALISAPLPRPVSDPAFLLANGQIALAAVACQARFVMGLVASGRSDDMRGVVGNFTTVAPVICSIDMDSRFSELLLQARYDIAETQEHQLYPVEQLTEADALRRDPSGALFFEATFEHRRGPPRNDSWCPLVVAASPDAVWVACDTVAIDAAVAQRLLTCFVATSATFSARPDARIGEVISLLEN